MEYDEVCATNLDVCSRNVHLSQNIHIENDFPQQNIKHFDRISSKETTVIIDDINIDVRENTEEFFASPQHVKIQASVTDEQSGAVSVKSGFLDANLNVLVRQSIVEENNNIASMMHNSSEESRRHEKLFKNVLPRPHSWNEYEPFKTLDEKSFSSKTRSHNDNESGNTITITDKVSNHNKIFKKIQYGGQESHNFVKRSSQEREEIKEVKKVDNKHVFNNSSSGKVFKKITYGDKKDIREPVQQNQVFQVRRSTEDQDLKTTSPLFPTSPKSRSNSTTQEEVCTYLKQIGYYDNITKRKFKYLDDICTEDEMLEDFKGEEVCGRIIYNFIYNGWRPDKRPPTQDWLKIKFPPEFSVTELYLYLTEQTQRVLAEYLKSYRVDGALLRFILKDNILAEQMLPNRTYVSQEEFEKLRCDFYGTFV